MIPTVLGRSIGRDPEFDGESADVLLSERDPVQSPAVLLGGRLAAVVGHELERLAGGPDRVVLPLELAAARGPLLCAEQLPRAVDRPVAQRPHRAELERPRRVLRRVEKEVPDHPWGRVVAVS